MCESVCVRLRVVYTQQAFVCVLMNVCKADAVMLELISANNINYALAILIIMCKCN